MKKIQFWNAKNKLKTKSFKNDQTLNAYISKHGITYYMLDGEYGYAHIIIGKR